MTIVKPFAVGKDEVTFAEWDACVAAGGCKHTAEAYKDRGWRPAIDVSAQCGRRGQTLRV